jgi:anti-sigma regulatory factor (Ser/Thr protein kinase)
MRLVSLDAGRLELTMDNDIGEIAAALPHLEAFGEHAQLDRKLQNKLEVIFEELVSNAIRHGFTAGSAQQVRVRADNSGEALTLVFEDDGAPFNPVERAAPAPFTDLASAPEGGLGIAVVKKMSQEVRYDSPRSAAADGFSPVNRVTVVLARQPVSAS